MCATSRTFSSRTTRDLLRGRMSPRSDDEESVQFSVVSGPNGSEDTSPPLKPAPGALGNGDINALLKMPPNLVDQDLIKQLNTLIVAKALPVQGRPLPGTSLAHL